MVVLGHLLLLVLTLYSSSLLAAEYDGTRIANRTIERVRTVSSGRRKTVDWASFVIPPPADRSITNTFPFCSIHRRRPPKPVRSRVLGRDFVWALLQHVLAGGGTLVPTRMWCVTLFDSSQDNFWPFHLCRIPTNTFGWPVMCNRRWYISFFLRFFADFWLRRIGMALESSPSHCRQFYHWGWIQSALHSFFTRLF